MGLFDQRPSFKDPPKKKKSKKRLATHSSTGSVGSRSSNNSLDGSSYLRSSHLGDASTNASYTNASYANASYSNASYSRSMHEEEELLIDTDGASTLVTEEKPDDSSVCSAITEEAELEEMAMKVESASRASGSIATPRVSSSLAGPDSSFSLPPQPAAPPKSEAFTSVISFWRSRTASLSSADPTATNTTASRPVDGEGKPLDTADMMTVMDAGHHFSLDLAEILGIDLEALGLGHLNPNTVVVCLGLVLLSVVVGIGLAYYPIGGRGGGKPLAQGTPFRLRNADTGKCFTGRRFESCHKTGAYFTLIVPPGTDYVKQGGLLQEVSSKKCLHVATVNNRKCLHIASDGDRSATSLCLGDQSRALSLGSCMDAKRAEGWQLVDGRLTNVLQDGTTVSKKAKAVPPEQEGELALIQGVAMLADLEVSFSSFTSMLKSN